MDKMFIYEPAMCCETGLCGVSIDPELLRISTALASLKKNGIEVKRFSLSASPQEFLNNAEVNSLLLKEGVTSLPITVLAGKIVQVGKYPTNNEIAHMLNISPTIFEQPESPDSNCCIGNGCC